MSMENVVLYYNEAAGSFRLGNEKLIQVLADYGYNVVASAIVKDEMQLLDPPDYTMIIIAGGDGSVKRICLLLVEKNIRDKKIALLPFGTANNIALHFEENIELKLEQICQKWASQDTRPFDVGLLTYGGNDFYFVESFGFGLFPSLIKTMDNIKELTLSKLSPTQELKLAIKKLYKSLFASKGTFYRIEYDNAIVEGHFLLVEIMNIKSLGPRWKIAPEASAGDGFLDIVLIPSSKKKQLVSYMKSLFKNRNTKFPFKTLKAKNIKVAAFEKNIAYHLDDTVLNSHNENVFQLCTLPSHFRFMV
ncbi:MAG: hypothetical protein DI598_10100 [Pseudopedobacter saltans]|uniref:Uncharacterized protein n=1 Tax=Pseudopedobacter saltans TaxID=151895 RepID=A0A2W5F0L8_9SPHI|nr:MAG: hypothetical protein DI598_10100 [Pseudopedobacter saltans]